MLVTMLVPQLGMITEPMCCTDLGFNDRCVGESHSPQPGHMHVGGYSRVLRRTRSVALSFGTPNQCL